MNKFLIGILGSVMYLDHAPKIIQDGLYMAYSLRRVVNGYNGAFIRVRRSNDNEEADFGVGSSSLSLLSTASNSSSGGAYDGQTLTTFVGANDGFVAVWYDQVSSADVTQVTTARQPRVVNAGSLEIENGKPAIRYDGTDSLQVDNGLMTYPISVFHVAKNDTNTQQYHWDGGGAVFTADSRSNFASGYTGAGGNKYAIVQYQGSGWDVGTTTTDTTNSKLFSTLIKADNSGSFYINGSVESDTGDTGVFPSGSWRPVTIGSRTNVTSSFLVGTYQEMIIYSNDQIENVANKQSIEGDINNYYSIY